MTDNVWGACVFSSKTHFTAVTMSNTIAELWQCVIQCSHHESHSQIHAVVTASLVHVLPTEAGQGIPIAADSWQEESISKTSNMTSASLLTLLLPGDTEDYKRSMKVHRHSLGREHNWKGVRISTFFIVSKRAVNPHWDPLKRCMKQRKSGSSAKASCYCPWAKK